MRTGSDDDVMKVDCPDRKLGRFLSLRARAPRAVDLATVRSSGFTSGYERFAGDAMVSSHGPDEW